MYKRQVEKSVEKLAGDDIPLGDRKNMVYLGSTVVYGHGRAVVTGTGMNTEMGKIAGVLAQAGSGQTPLQRKLSELSKILTFLVLGICVVIFGFSVLRAGKLTFDSMIDLFMVAVSLAVAAIPEGLATVVTIVLSIGVTNMSKRNAIIRRLTAVETLGCAQIICSDKTGTPVSYTHLDVYKRQEQGKGVRRKGDEVFGVGMAQMEFAVEGGKVLQSIADAVEVGKDADGARREAVGLAAV